MVRAVHRRLAPWLDLRSGRSLAVLAGVPFVVLLGPLALDVFWAWFLAVPWEVRRAAGHSVVVGAMVVGLVRTVRVRAGDRWVPLADVGDATRAGRWLPWALRLGVASLLIPILRNPDGLGFADWDFVLDKFEAARRSMVIWGEFPWWNPWCRGGFPLAAEPQIGAVSMATPLILAFGTGIGLRVAAILCVWIAVEGAYRLGCLWLREPWGAAVAAMVFGLNGAVAVNTADGYIIVMSYCSLPWLVYHAFRIGEGVTQGLWLGFWAGFAILNGIQYLTIYAVALTGLIWLRAMVVQPAGRRVEIVRGTMAAAGVFLVLCGWRVATVLPVLLGDRRETVTFWDESLFAALRTLVDRPRPDWPEFLAGRGWAVYTSLTSYIGAVVVILAASSVRNGWRWWHTLIALTGWLAIGSSRWYQPSYWLMDWPVIGSAHVVTRWRFVTMLGIGLAAGSVVARWRASGVGVWRALAVAATVVIAADYLAIGFDQLPIAFSVPAGTRLEPGPPVRDIVNVGDGLGYPCARLGYGVIRGYEPMLSYMRDAPTLRKARDEPGYRGEAWTERGEVSPESWSPNRVVFRVRPGEEVFVNQNPGSWWLVNGRRAFAGRGCAEPLVPFSARADETGRLELRIDPPGLRAGICLHLVGASLLVFCRPRWIRIGSRLRFPLIDPIRRIAEEPSGGRGAGPVDSA